MKLPTQFISLEGLSLPAGPLHLAIGIFDGVHLGHRAVIEAAVQSARLDGGIAVVLTFAPHPSALFRPDRPTLLLMEPVTKARVLGNLGVSAIITQSFTPAFAAIGAEEFLPWLKERMPRLVALYVGDNWRFGRGRAGDINFLVGEGRKHDLRVFSAPRVNLGGEPISSSRIRMLLQSGEVAAANRLLGYTYFSESVVLPGKQLGRTLGFPTLNLAWDPDLRPRYGVYVVRVAGGNSSAPFPAVANYGLRPTVEQTTEPRLEVHVLTDCPFNQGDGVTVEWLHFLRPEMKFTGVDELRAQIERDRVAALEDFSLR